MRYRESDPKIAEIAVLKVLMTWPGPNIDKAIDHLGETSKCFYDIKNQWVYDAIIYLYKEGLEIGFTSVTMVLFEWGKLAFIGGGPYMEQIYDDPVSTDHNMDFYIEIMKNDYIRRELAVACSAAGSVASEAGSDPRSAMLHLEDKLLMLEDTTTHGQPKSIFEIMPEIFSEIEDRRKNPNKVSGITTGVREVDTIMDYLRPDTLNILAARPSVGKTALAVNIALAAAKSGSPVLFVSMEMGQKSLVKRFLSIQASTPYKILSGAYNPLVQDKMGKAALELSDIPIRIIAPEKFDTLRLKGIARNFKKKNGDKMPLIVIDYLQKCVRANKSDMRRHEAVGEFTGDCKALARDLNCPLLLLCQISREGKEFNNPFKAKDSLKDSGNIEEDADTIMVCVSEPSDEITQTCKDFSLDSRNVVNFGIVKNREGAVGLCPLYFDKQTQSIESLNSYVRRGTEEYYTDEEEPF